jgi:hypothetical protein
VQTELKLRNCFDTHGRVLEQLVTDSTPVHHRVGRFVRHSAFTGMCCQGHCPIHRHRGSFTVACIGVGVAECTQHTEGRSPVAATFSGLHTPHHCHCPLCEGGPEINTQSLLVQHNSLSSCVGCPSWQAAPTTHLSIKQKPVHKPQRQRHCLIDTKVPATGTPPLHGAVSNHHTGQHKADSSPAAASGQLLHRFNTLPHML